MSEVKWNPAPRSRRRYLVKILVASMVTTSLDTEIRTAEYVGGMWLVDGLETTPDVIEFAELPE
jgi:hypothetical protein